MTVARDLRVPRHVVRLVCQCLWIDGLSTVPAGLADMVPFCHLVGHVVAARIGVLPPARVAAVYVG